MAKFEYITIVTSDGKERTYRASDDVKYVLVGLGGHLYGGLSLQDEHEWKRLEEVSDGETT